MLYPTQFAKLADLATKLGVEALESNLNLTTIHGHLIVMWEGVREKRQLRQQRKVGEVPTGRNRSVQGSHSQTAKARLRGGLVNKLDFRDRA